MGISTYTDLVTSVANWLHRADLTSVIPDFVDICEANLNRDLRVSQMETSAALTVTAGSATLPADYLASRMILTDASPPKALSYVQPDDWARYGQQNGTSMYYTILGDTVKFAEIGTSSPTLYYYQKIPALVETTAETNWLILAHPDVYLCGTLAASAPYIGNDARLPTWMAQYVASVSAIKAADKARTLGSGLQVRPDVFMGA